MTATAPVSARRLSVLVRVVLSLIAVAACGVVAAAAGGIVPAADPTALRADRVPRPTEALRAAARDGLPAAASDAAALLRGAAYGVGLQGSQAEHGALQPASSVPPGQAAAAPLTYHVPVEIAPARLESGYTTLQRFVGRVEARQTSELGFERAGLLVRVHVEEGDRVEQGAPLAELDTALLQAQRREWEASLAQAQALLMELRNGPRDEVVAAARQDLAALQAALDLAERTERRRLEVMQGDAGTEAEYDEARTQRQTLTAQRDAARERLRELEAGTRRETLERQAAVVEEWQARLASLDVQLAKSVLRAPFAALVSVRYADAGAFVGAGQPVLRILEREGLRARILVAGTAAHEVQAGTPVTLTWRGQREPRAVQAVLPARDTTTRGVPLLVSLPPSWPALVGDLVELSWERRWAQPGVWVPLDALQEDVRGLWSVYVVEAAPAAASAADSSRISRRSVHVLFATADRAYVAGTLQAGERMVVGGAHRVTVGQSVRAVPATAMPWLVERSGPLD